MVRALRLLVVLALVAAAGFALGEALSDRLSPAAGSPLAEAVDGVLAELARLRSSATGMTGAMTDAGITDGR